jgi:carbamate kinase
VLLILTDVDGVYREYGTDDATLLEHLSRQDAQEMLSAGGLGAGSMGPKVEAALDFVEAGGKRAVIADLANAPAALEGKAGTTID